MIQHVYENALCTQKADSVIIATDDIRIAEVVEDFGGNVLMTSHSHKTGTDRVIEVSEMVDSDLYINVQGDEPLLHSDDIDLLIERMQVNPRCDVATLCYPISKSEAKNPNIVKLVCTATGRALYFSRSLIPHQSHTAEKFDYLKHVGVYGFRKHVLATYKHLPHSILEQQEKLEQLRLLEAGFTMDVIQTAPIGRGVDTPEDLQIVIETLTAGNSTTSQTSLVLKSKAENHTAPEKLPTIPF